MKASKIPARLQRYVDKSLLPETQLRASFYCRTSQTSTTDSPKKGNAHMKIAIPVTGDSLNPHFGHCEKFAFVEVDSKIREVIATTEIPAPEHQPGLLPRWLWSAGRPSSLLVAWEQTHSRCFRRLRLKLSPTRRMRVLRLLSASIWMDRWCRSSTSVNTSAITEFADLA
jgi:hypothetical protein